MSKSKSASPVEETVTTPVSSPEKGNKSKKGTPKTRSSPRRKSKVNYKNMHEGNSDFEDEERSKSEDMAWIKKGNGVCKERRAVTVQFEEDGNIIEMDTDFMSGEKDVDQISDESSEE